MKYDVFISHASEDKPEVVRPLAEKLTERGIKVWLDEQELTIGDSLRRNIDLGLANSRFGLVVLSHAFFSKEWPQKELDGLVAREDGREKVILPVWHNLAVDDIRSYSPLLADRVGGTTNRGIDFLVDQVIRALELDEKRKEAASPTLAKVEDTTNELKHKLENTPKEFDNGFLALDGLIVDALDAVQDLVDNNMGEVTGLRTGLIDFDSLTLGLHKQEVTLVGARPLVGKSSLALTIAHNVAVDEGLPVAFIASNCSPRQFTNRLLGLRGFIHTKHIETGLLTEDEWNRLPDVIEGLRTANVFFVDQTELSIDEVASRTRQLAAQFGGTLGLIVIDGNQTFGATGAGADHAVEDTFKVIRGLARELSCPLLVTTPLSRTVDTRVDGTPQISDIPHIDQIERYVDNIVFLKTAMAYPNTNVTRIIVARHRRGPVAQVDTAFQAQTGRFLNLAPDHYMED